MADSLSSAATVNTRPKLQGPIARLDFFAYRFERAICWASLLVMAAVYFLAIVERELTAGAGQNAIDRFILRWMGQTPESAGAAQLATIHDVWSPVFFGALMLLLILAATLTVRPWAGRASVTGRQRLMLFGAAALTVVGGGLAITLAPSWVMVGGGLLLALAAGLWGDRRERGGGTRAVLWAVGIGAVLLGVVRRIEPGYVWSKELSMLLLMWVGFLGASMASYEERNIQVDFVRKNVPRHMLRHYEAFGSLVTALFTAVLAVLAYESVEQGVKARVLLPNIAIPDYLVPLPIALAFVVIALRYLLRSIRLFRGSTPPPGLDMAPTGHRGFLIAIGGLLTVAVLGFLGLGAVGGGLVLTLLLLLLVGAPLYVVIGGLALGCFGFWPEHAEWMESLQAFSGNFNLMARMRDLADQESLIAIPFFMVAGAIMSRGAIARQLVECARAAFGWLPGGLAISTVSACMFFAAISGSSPVTVITIGAIMYPALREANYSEEFSLGLVTSAGSLGIIIPPSIPMIVYAIFATMNGAPVDIKDLFIAGIGPGLVIAVALGLVCMTKGAGVATEPFSLKRLGRATRDGFWALFLPAFILIGIYFGIFNAIEGSAIAVVLALGIETLIHRQLRLRDLPSVLADSAALMGSILVIISVSLGLSEFLTIRQIPESIVNWLATYELTPIGFVLLLNVMLIIVGCLMDIISALILFVPLIMPLALQLGIDPIHLGLIFIVNLEIGYLTPPLGLNLFVSSGFFQKPFGLVMRSVVPFIGALAVSLAIITAVPTISLGLVNLMHDRPFAVGFPSGTHLKPIAAPGSAPTTFVDATRKQESGDSQGASSLRAITDRSRESDAEATGDLVDFETFGVRAYAEREDGEHVRTRVIITSETENCFDEALGATASEWALRIVIPAHAKANATLDITSGAVGPGQATASLVKFLGGAVTETRPADSGVVLVIEPEAGADITVLNEDGYSTHGLFGAFELKFGEDVINGKFVPAPCEVGKPLYQ